MSALDLLRALGSGVHAGKVGSATAASAPKASATGVDFASLLDQARAGKIASNVPVRLGDGVRVDLNAEQLQRLSVAGDQAEAQGAGRAVVLIDGMALSMDVATRTITGQIDMARGGTLTGVDAVVVASASGSTGVAGVLGPPGAIAPASLEAKKPANAA